MTTAADVRDRVAESWRAFRDAIDDLDLDETTSAGWSRKEMASHATFWLETVQPYVTGMWRGDPSWFDFTFTSGYQADERGWPDAATHNAREAAWAREQSTEAVMARLDAAGITVREFLETVTDDEATEHGDYFIAVAEHLDEHRLELLGA